MVVTLLVVFHGLKNDRKNKETKQCWKNDGVNHGSSMKGCLGLALQRPSPCASQGIVTWGAAGRNSVQDDLERDRGDRDSSPIRWRQAGPTITQLREVVELLCL